MRRRAVVALQPDDGGAGKVALEAEDVAHLGAAPGVDRLVVVADAADVAVRARQRPQPQVLGDVGVLVLVDQDVAELPLVALEHVGLVQQQRQRVQEQVAEVGGVQHLQPLLVVGVDPQRQAVEGIGAFRVGDLPGHEPAVLPPLDQRGEEPGRGSLQVGAAGLQDLLDQPELVVGVEDGEVGLEPDPLGVGAQHARGDGVEGADPPALDRAAEQAGDPLAHLPRRLVGEGHRQDLPGPRLAGGEDVGKPGGQHPGLAGAGAGQHQNRPVDRLDRPALHLVQLGDGNDDRRRHGRGSGSGRRLRRRWRGQVERVGHGRFAVLFTHGRYERSGSALHVVGENARVDPGAAPARRPTSLSIGLASRVPPNRLNRCDRPSPGRSAATLSHLRLRRAGEGKSAGSSPLPPAERESLRDLPQRLPLPHSGRGAG